MEAEPASDDPPAAGLQPLHQPREVGRSPLMQELGGLFGPYYGNVLPYTRRETEVSDAEVVYRLTPHSAIGVTHGYQNSITTTWLFQRQSDPSHNFNGSVFYSQEISRRLTRGADAIFDIYSDPDARTRPRIFCCSTPGTSLPGTPSRFGAVRGIRATTWGTGADLYGTISGITITWTQPTQLLRHESWRPTAGLMYS